MNYRDLIVKPRTERSPIVRILLGGPFWALVATLAMIILNCLGVI